MSVDFRGCFWIGVPAQLYQGRLWNGKLETQIAYFRQTFDLAECGSLMLHISASSRYRLYINGSPILSGPCKGDRWRHFYESVDVSKYLVKGKNLIAVKVVAYPPYEAQYEYGIGQGPMSIWNSAMGPCLAVSGEVLGSHGKRLANLNTGASAWMVCLDSAISWETPRLSFWMGGMEIVHGDKLPVGWKNSFSPQGEWAAAEVRWTTQSSKTGGIFPLPLKKRPIPLLYERETDFCREMPCRKSDFTPFSFENPASTAVIPPGKKAEIELDAGALTTAYVLLKVKGGKGSKIILRYAESYAEPLSPADEANGVTIPRKGDRCDSLHYHLLGAQDVYYPSGKEEEYQPFWFRTFRFMRLEVYTKEQALTIEKPKLTETGYPLQMITGFYSSDKSLEKIWEISKNTLQRCMHETYEDCPYYEQMQYTQDTRLQMLFTYALCGDTRMAERTIDDYHASLLPEGILQSRYPAHAPQVIPVFALHWIFMLEDYYEQTGDLSIPKRYRPTMDAVLDWYERYIGKAGLVEHMPYWQHIDWVEEWSEQEGMPNASLKGPSAIHNLEYAYALQAAARLNRLTDREDSARDCEAKAARILALVEKTCWNEEAKLYMEGPAFEEYSQHAQVFAVLTGLVEGEKARMILTNALERKGLAKCSFPLMFYFIRALEKAGLYHRSSVFIDALKEFADLNVTTVPETPFRPRSECHAWGAFPLYEFPRSLLGVRSGNPGWEKIIIKPQFVGAKDCGGVVFTPKGNVDVAWERKDGAIRLYGHAPENVTCTIMLPNNRQEELMQGGSFDYTVAK